MASRENVDVVLIGSGIMSATLGAMLKDLQPDLDIRLYERLNYVARESSDPWNNAGTGHAALCELNYTPQGADGTIDTAKAATINEQFLVSRQYWSHLVGEGVLRDPNTFINSVPHISYGRGEAGRDYIKARYEAMRTNPLFADIEYSDDPSVHADWLPLMFGGRSGDEVNGVSRFQSGTDVDFGSLARQLLTHIGQQGVPIRTGHAVVDLTRSARGWIVKIKDTARGETFEVDARFVFIGAGGGALPLLQKTGIAEGHGYGGFPVSGQFLRTADPELVAKHRAKVYGQAATGAPPMSVPHLDTRVIDGREYLMFGPYAGFSPKFLKTGKLWDLPGSVRGNNIGSMLGVARDNTSLIKYLVSELVKNKDQRLESLREFYPEAEAADWELITAGQRVQIMKKDPKRGGVLAFGTEVVSAADGSVAALLGASPGASTAVSAMIGVLRTGFATEFPAWEKKLTDWIPSFGRKLEDDPKLLAEVSTATATALKLKS